MAFTKLTKEQKARKGELLAELRVALDKYEQQRVLLEEATEVVNTAIAECNAFTDEILEQQQEYYDEKSQNWQDGDAGAAYVDWQNAWDNAIDEIGVPEQIDDSFVDEWEERPDAP